MDSADPVRLLQRGSGYTDQGRLAVAGAGEAIPADYQVELTERAQRAHREQLIAEWLKARSRIVSSLDHFEQVAAPPNSTRSGLRAVRRTVESVGRQLGAG